MKYQALFPQKDKSKKKCRLLQFLFGALRVNLDRLPAQANSMSKQRVSALQLSIPLLCQRSESAACMNSFIKYNMTTDGSWLTELAAPGSSPSGH